MSEDILQAAASLERMRKRLAPSMSAEVPPVYLPFLHRAVNPIAGTTTFGDYGQPWPNIPVAFGCAFYVVAPNNAGNYWTITLNTNSVLNVATAVAVFNTSAYAANTPIRAPTITSFLANPATTDPYYRIDAVTTGAPGALYLWPTLAVLRIGN